MWRTPPSRKNSHQQQENPRRARLTPGYCCQATPSPQTCSQGHHRPQAQQSKAGPSSLLLRAAALGRTDALLSLSSRTNSVRTGPDAGHSPSSHFRVKVQQGASDQVAGCGAKDGRRVKDGWKGSRALGSGHTRSTPPT